ncbi:MAG: aminotransferase class V-fold PLP-dependent enzyme [Planctomycetota bacterium]
MTHDDLLEWRKEFPILENTNYLISHSLGAMPRAVYDKLTAFADQWATRGVRAWAEGWWEKPISTGNLIGKILGANPGEVVMHQNVSVAQSVIISCFEAKPPRRKVVYTELNFPSVMYVYEAHKRVGFEIEVVRSDDGITVPTERLLEAIDERTLLVPISHVLYKSAYIQDVSAIIARAHQVGAMVVLDTYQSAGTIPFQVKELDVDFVVGGSVKWLCGGPGAGYLYVRPDHAQRLEPRVTGWMAHQAPFNFETGPIRYAQGAWRFLHGSPHVPALFSAEAGYEIIARVGVDRIRQKSMRQTALLIDRARARGFKVNTPLAAKERAGTVTVDVPHGPAVTRELCRREIVVDYRPGAGVRISPHFYTKDEELERVIGEIDDILATRAYERHLAAEVKY